MMAITVTELRALMMLLESEGFGDCEVSCNEEYAIDGVDGDCRKEGYIDLVCSFPPPERKH